MWGYLYKYKTNSVKFTLILDDDFKNNKGKVK